MANVESAKGVECYTVGILTVSDTSSKDSTKDLSGPSLKNILESKRVFSVLKTKIVPDEFDEIQETVKQWCDVEKLDLIVTTGGTGFGVRDITPEAIQPLLHKLCPGITQKMVSDSLQKTPFAALSRPISGIREKTIIMTVPGSLKGSKENAEAVIDILPHAIDLIRGGTGENVHSQLRDHQCAGDFHHKHDHAKNVSTRSFLSDPLSGPVTQRQRKSPYQMISVKDALSKITEHANTLPIITVPVNQNLIGAVLAENVIAKEPVPGYRASILDGYAVVANDGPGIYPVVGVSIASGSSESFDKELKPGQITRITTGGPVPPGATAVVMVEDTTLVRASADGFQEMEVQIHVQVRDNENIREVGSDLSVGTVVARKDELVTAVGGEIGVLASVGVKEVQVYKRPVLGILSTGNEVVDHNDLSELKYGAVRDSNRPALLAIAKATGFEAKDFGIVGDDPKEIERTLRSALSQVDVLVTTGGVSMGELDLLKPILEQSLGAIIHFGRVKMKPGKPTTFATIPGYSPDGQEKLIFGLPGNPVSAVVTFYLFVLPTLRKISGYENWTLPILQAELTNDIFLDPRPEYHRAIISYDREKGKLLASSTGHQISSRILSVRSCNSLLILPEKTDELTKLSKGTTVDAMLIGQLH
ncbi:1804_t:CDS:10 [Acaulospora morrowiae]|uniref:1804_t:CDS:1 n=1 Tax=Acaulospora morrowiae TaxID=94023 RepID=A0A9N9FES8_9GLOM|nr:1804_t:CDS:10 [Acaulospora morrowiae]